MIGELGQLLVSTRFSSIYRKGDRAIKVTSTGSVVKPHDPTTELALLRRLQEPGNPFIIELLSFDTKQGDVILQFPYIELNLYQYLLEQYQKRCWNPYLLDGDKSTQGSQRINKLPLQQAVGFFQQLAKALQYIHSKGIIHRDVKLQNVLVDVNSGSTVPRLVIIDFGIAYHPEVSEETPNNKITDVSTSIYKAPELLFSVKNYTGAVDVWALLVVVSQFFQTSSASEKFVPAFVDDGSEELEEGSDIRLISSIFHSLGIPTLQQWPEVRDHGSPAFEGMFGASGDGRYLVNQSQTDQREKCLHLFPRLQEVSEPSKTHLVDCLLRMMPFESSKRTTAGEIVTLLHECNGQI
ncbi:LAME_0A06942g1_1 [Lachancea meyersii CBS 8951]|uniref:LAME_0A06942g1_1 n=1 Tax=Lachancea meyersii CBS 8951 TaxID=1266667 RepID=A0A1G4IQM5_9SACH|nr:LAME_0A06942g1_1 [Lachancea meyersii CBS 8951]